MSCRISLINIHTLSQFNESSYLNYMNQGVGNGDVNGGNCSMNSHTLSESKKHNSLDSTKKRDENVSNTSAM